MGEKEPKPGFKPRISHLVDHCLTIGPWCFEGLWKI